VSPTDDAEWCKDCWSQVWISFDDKVISQVRIDAAFGSILSCHKYSDGGDEDKIMRCSWDGIAGEPLRGISRLSGGKVDLDLDTS
jgi:hypothetical protein